MKDNFKDYVSAELRSLRAEHNYKQKDVANKANVDVMTIVRYENNSTSMQLDMIEKILSVYNVNLEKFFKIISAKIQNK
jgi:transcriptional regulator with XRE-family HTH domain